MVRANLKLKSIFACGRVPESVKSDHPPANHAPIRCPNSPPIPVSPDPISPRRYPHLAQSALLLALLLFAPAMIGFGFSPYVSTNHDKTITHHHNCSPPLYSTVLMRRRPTQTPPPPPMRPLPQPTKPQTAPTTPPDRTSTQPPPPGTWLAADVNEETEWFSLHHTSGGGRTIRSPWGQSRRSSSPCSSPGPTTNPTCVASSPATSYASTAPVPTPPTPPTPPAHPPGRLWPPPVLLHRVSLHGIRPHNQSGRPRPAGPPRPAPQQPIPPGLRHGRLPLCGQHDLPGHQAQRGLLQQLAHGRDQLSLRKAQGRVYALYIHI